MRLLCAYCFFPFQTPEIEASFDRRLYDPKIGRDVKIPRRKQRVVPDMQYLLDASRARFARGGPIFYSWKERISDRLEGLRDERRTNTTCRLPTPQAHHPP